MADIGRGMDQLDTLLANERFASLASSHGVIVEYVHNDGMGSVRLATVTEDRSVTWDQHFSPRP